MNKKNFYNKDPDCDCTDCIVDKIKIAIDLPVPDLVKILTEIARWKKNIGNDDIVRTNGVLSYFEKIEDNIYGDFDDIRKWLDLIYLIIDNEDKRQSSKILVSKLGVGKTSAVNIQKRYYEKLKTIKELEEKAEWEEKNDWY